VNILKSQVKYWIAVPFFWLPRRVIGCQFNGRWLLQGRNFGKSSHSHQVRNAPKPTRFIDLTTETNLQKYMQPERNTSELLPLSHWIHTQLYRNGMNIFTFISILGLRQFSFYILGNVSGRWSIRDIFNHWTVVS